MELGWLRPSDTADQPDNNPHHSLEQLGSGIHGFVDFQHLDSAWSVCLPITCVTQEPAILGAVNQLSGVSWESTWVSDFLS